MDGIGVNDDRYFKRQGIWDRALCGRYQREVQPETGKKLNFVRFVTAKLYFSVILNSF